MAINLMVITIKGKVLMKLLSELPCKLFLGAARSDWKNKGREEELRSDNRCHDLPWQF